MLHAWTKEYQHMMLCAWWWIPWPAGEDRWAALTMSGSTMSRRMTMVWIVIWMPYRCLRCGDLRSPGVTEWHNGPLRLCDDDGDDIDVAYCNVALYLEKNSINAFWIAYKHCTNQSKLGVNGWDGVRSYTALVWCSVISSVGFKFIYELNWLNMKGWLVGCCLMALSAQIYYIVSCPSRKLIL